LARGGEARRLRSLHVELWVIIFGPPGDLAGLFSSLAPEIAVRARLGQAVGPPRDASLCPGSLALRHDDRERAVRLTGSISVRGSACRGFLSAKLGPFFGVLPNCFPSQNRVGDMQESPSLLSLYAISSRLKRYGYVNFSVAQPASVAGGIFGNLRLQQHGLCNGLTSPPLDRVMG